MPSPSKNGINSFYKLLNTRTGERHDITYGSQLLANVINTPHRLAADATPLGLRTDDRDLGQRFKLIDTVTGIAHPLDWPMTLARDAALPGGRTGSVNIDPTNSNHLRGGMAT